MKTAQDLVLDAKTRIREIGHQEMLALQQAGTPIVDVREPAEYLEGHIPGAINIPRGVLESAPEYVLFSLPKGGVSEPVDTPRGYWIVQRIE